MNTTTGVVQSIDFNLLNGLYGAMGTKQAFSPSDVDVELQGGYTNLFVNYLFNGSTVYGLEITVPVTTFIGYAGGAICSRATLNCASSSNVYTRLNTDYFASGQLTAVVTPEPSSISYLLLSLAAVAALPFLRKRVLQDWA